MIGPFEVQWSDVALDAWKRLPFARARAVAVAIDRFVREGESGPVPIVVVGTEYLLFVDDLVVLMLIDGGTLHIDRLRRA